MFSSWDCDANKRCYIQIFIENDAFYYHILSQQELRGSTLEPDNLSTSIHQTSFWYYYHMKLKTQVDKSVKILCLDTALYNSIYQACYLYNWPVNILIITKFSIYFLSCSDNLISVPGCPTTLATLSIPEWFVSPPTVKSSTRTYPGILILQTNLESKLRS